MSFFRKDERGNIYYNIEVANKTSLPVVLNYTDVRSQAIIPNADDYKLAILRFQVDLSDVPFALFPTQEFETFQNPPYNTIDNAFWGITLDDGAGGIAQRFAQYLDYGGTTAYIHSPNHFCDMLNLCIKEIAVFLVINDRIPYFTYNKEAGSIDLIAPINYRQSSSARKIYVNKNLYDAFAKDFPGAIRDLDTGRYYELFIYPTGDNSITTPISDANNTTINAAEVDGYKMKSYFPNLGNLVAPKAIVFTTSRIPISSEYVSDNLDLNNDTSFSFARVLKDFELSLEGSDAILTKGKQNFSISSQFQYTTLSNGGEGIKNIDLQAFWRDQHGRLTPLTIPASSSFSMKMLFEVK